MIIYCWNIRGLNGPSKVQKVKRIIVENKISNMAILETRVREGNRNKVERKFGNKLSWIANQYSGKGRIWVLWDKMLIDLKLVEISKQCVTIRICDKGDTDV